MARKKEFVVFGLGRFGQSVAMALADYKNQMAAEVAAKDAKLQSELE